MSLIVLETFRFKYCCRFHCVEKGPESRSLDHFQKIYLENNLICEAEILQQSLYMFTHKVLCKSETVEQKARMDMRWSDPSGFFLDVNVSGLKFSKQVKNENVGL